ncbi:sulfhydryl oxidase 2 [Bombina bombina]|uniref:sulfhydryl oxidase 2 n=1 Tax=Bombina bombina TaxID=8345 RepID=UPI00235A4B54|nr:sulfhydryl oxidase 2 [Bombina bombina]
MAVLRCSVLMLLLAGGAFPGRAAKLYGPQDPLTILDSSSLTGAVYNSSTAWLLEFYSSWCGHCINYAPTWKALAGDVMDWETVIRIGVVDCAEEVNFEMCKEYNVQFYPTFRFFKAFTKTPEQGENFKGSDHEVQTVRQMMIDFLQTSPPANKPGACPLLEPISSSEVTTLLTKKEKYYTAIIFESEDSYVGREVILDLVLYDNLVVRRALNTDKAALEKLGVVTVPSCYLIYPNGSHGLINNLKPLRSLFSSQLKSLPSVRRRILSQPIPTRPIQEGPIEEIIWKEFDKSKLYMADLESGLHYLLRVELPRHQALEGEKLKAFKDFVTIAYKLFPGRSHVMKLLETLQEWLVSMPLDKIPCDAILDIVNNKMRISGIFLTNRVEWVGCQGSSHNLREYPCSLWKLFHSFTVQAAVQPDALANTVFDDNPQAVLQTMRGYIREFFGCRECAKHFEAMVKDSIETVKTLDEAVLWLWSKHNIVNNRLAGAPSEDPKFPKVQWPTPDICAACHEEVHGLHSWNEKEVLDFLKQYYSSQGISLQYSDPKDQIDTVENDSQNEKLPANKPLEEKLEKHSPQKDLTLKPQFLDKLVDSRRHSDSRLGDSRQSVNILGLGFSNIDMSLCVVLYVTSCLFLIIMYFFFRLRSRRWKIRYNRPYV